MTVQDVSDFLRSTTARLAASYLAIIMVLSISFSYVLYKTSAHELDRQIPPTSLFGPQPVGPGDEFGGYHTFFVQRIEEARSHLINRLIFLNLSVLLAGGALSYYLARRTLEPIEAAMEAQSRFVSDASHELRTPLTAILTSNEVALRRPSLTSAQAKKLIKSNVEEMTRLKALSDGLLSLSKDTNVTLQPVSLQDVAAEALNRVVAAAQAKHIEIQDKVPATKVLGDSAGLIQTVTILLDNAIKYSGENSTIYLSGSHRDGYGYFSVRDQGTGISPKDLPHIFERFYRADPARSTIVASGHGIGLSIAQQIIEQHNGKITVTSKAGQGSTFTIQLPLA